MSEDFLAVHPARTTCRRAPRPVVRCKRVPVPSTAGVYFIRSGVKVKIGCATNLQRRLQDLQSGAFSALCVVGFIPTPDQKAARALELELHRAFRDERVRGEWFRLTEAVVDTLAARGTLDRRALLI